MLPEALLPYAFGIGFLVSEFFPTEDTSSIVFAFILGALFLSCPICNVIYMIKSRKSDPRELLREALTVKLIHIPAFVGIFIMGVIAAIMIFMTLPLILLLVLWDYLILLSSGMLSVFALIKNTKRDKALSVIAIICQFFFCADVISLLLLRLVSKKQPIITE